MRLADHGKGMTVLGAIDADAMGPTLTHEHVLVDFDGATLVSPDIDQDDAFELILPYLFQVKELGYQTFVECTPSYNTLYQRAVKARKGARECLRS